MSLRSDPPEISLAELGEDFLPLYSFACAVLAAGVVLTGVTGSIRLEATAIGLAGTLVAAAALWWLRRYVTRPATLVSVLVLEVAIVGLSIGLYMDTQTDDSWERLVVLGAGSISLSYAMVVVASLLGMRLRGHLRSDI